MNKAEQPGAAREDSGAALGLYIHVPFCASKCPYCDFYSVTKEESLMDRYVQAVCEALRVYLPGASGREGPRAADTVYFGGGTPSLLGAARIGRILAELAALCALREPEITVEVNPAACGRDFFREIAAAGVNRISVGLQSARDAELRFLGRRHSAEDAARTAETAMEAGIRNLSFDLMLALPGQTADSIRESVAFCRAHGASHLSAYLLKIEPGTPFATRQNMRLPDDDESADLYLAACEAAENAGFHQYEISNFAAPGRESRHNLKYWRGEDYLGIGPAAHSCVNGRRFHFPRDIAGFLELPQPVSDGKAGGFEEFAMLRLRLREGLDLDVCEREYGILKEKILEKAHPMQQGGLLEIQDGRILLTRQGFLLSNAVIAKLAL